MMAEPLVSVIIPFYNRPDTLKQAVDSVLRQTYPALEIVLVDDCSAEEFSLGTYTKTNVAIHYMRNSTNSGPAFSRFEGLMRSRGEYVVFLDSDDVLAENYVTKQVRTMEGAGRPPFVYCFTKVFDRTGVVADRHVPQVSVNKILPGILLQGRIWCTSSCLWNRESLQAVTPFEGYTWEDYRLDIAAGLMNNEVACTPEYLCFYRLDSSSKLSKNKSRKNLWLLQSLKGILETIFDTNANFERSDLFINKLLNKYVTCLMQVEDTKSFNEYYEALIKFPSSLTKIHALLPLIYGLPIRARKIALRLVKRRLRRIHGSETKTQDMELNFREKIKR